METQRQRDTSTKQTDRQAGCETNRLAVTQTGDVIVLEFKAK